MGSNISAIVKSSIRRELHTRLRVYLRNCVEKSINKRRKQVIVMREKVQLVRFSLVNCHLLLRELSLVRHRCWSNSARRYDNVELYLNIGSVREIRKIESTLEILKDIPVVMNLYEDCVWKTLKCDEERK